MAIKKLTLVPHAILRAKSSDVEFDKKTKELLTNLQDTLLYQSSPKGVGLSAPQIGKNKNVFLTLEKETQITFFLNPQITAVSKEMTLGQDEEDEPILEGCLSIPNIYGPVPRHEWIEVSFVTLKNNEFVAQSGKYHDFTARVIQHEIDHLHGVLFTDYILKLDLPLYEHKGRKMVEIDKEFAKAF